MDDSSFGGIRTLLTALNGRWRRGLPAPGVAVAASATQSFQSIIGCDLTRIFMNRTNNGLERYNRHFNGLFNKKPSLLEFVQIVEEESRFQDQKNTDIRCGRRKEVEREERTIPVVPVAYSDFLSLIN
jgi:hypothetical protein